MGFRGARRGVVFKSSERNEEECRHGQACFITLGGSEFEMVHENELVTEA